MSLFLGCARRLTLFGVRVSIFIYTNAIYMFALRALVESNEDRLVGGHLERSVDIGI